MPRSIRSISCERSPLLDNLESKPKATGWIQYCSIIVFVSCIILSCTLCRYGLFGKLMLLIGNRWFPPFHPFCPLPEQSRWCRSSVGFHIACLHDDIVCNHICTWGYWEYASTSQIGLPPSLTGQVIDIGAHVGWYTLLFAHEGFSVDSFEPLPTNVKLIEASLCANPKMRGMVRLHPIALSAEPANCKVFSSRRNVGNGTLCCPKDECSIGFNPMYELRHASLITSTLDSELRRLDKPVAFMKIDVEGYECQVLKGGSNLFSRHPPKYLLSEIWNDEVGCSSSNYVSRLRNFGYTISLTRAARSFLVENRAEPSTWSRGDILAIHSA